MKNKLLNFIALLVIAFSAFTLAVATPKTTTDLPDTDIIQTDIKPPSATAICPTADADVGVNAVLQNEYIADDFTINENARTIKNFDKQFINNFAGTNQFIPPDKSWRLINASRSSELTDFKTDVTGISPVPIRRE